MKRLIGAFVVLGLIGGAVWIGLASRTEQLDPTLSINCGFSLCAHEALVEAEILIERCSSYEECALLSYDGTVFFEFVGVSAGGGLRCNKGECGAADNALQSGWDPGTWRIEPRLPRSLRHLDLVEPVEIELEAGETYDVEFVFRDPLKGWPRGPFAHNCFAENADGEGDFDGDGLEDRVSFRPSYSTAGFLGWHLGQRWGDGRSAGQPIDAECPEVIGAVDIDGDGKDELFYDTGKGMTAAVVDILKLHKGRFKNVIEVPDDFSIYVGASNAGSSGIECWRNRRTGGLHVREKSGDRVANLQVYIFRGRRLVEGPLIPGSGDPRPEINCFGLQWSGY